MSAKLTVELVYDINCPNVLETRKLLIKSLQDIGLPLSWKEWDRNSGDTPPHAKQFGSPTILVNGQDLVGSKPSKENSCRIYQDSNGKLSGVPSLDNIKNAFAHATKKNGADVKSIAASLPGIGLVLLPKLTCAACWPVYAGILSSLGIGFFNYSEYLLPITIAALLIALAALWFRANNRRGFAPFGLGVFSSFLLIVGKFVWDAPLLVYAGVVFLIIANVWNAWPKQKQTCINCPPSEKGEIKI